jgi:hypothetical protein
MPLKLNVGRAKKIGQPEYGSLSASCHVELELDQSLLHSDLDGFHRQVSKAFVACCQAVNRELARQQQSTAASNANGHSQLRDTAGTNGRRHNRDRSRRATSSQVRAIETIAKRQRVNLPALLSDRYEISSPEELSIVEASRLIDELKELAEGDGDHR